MPTTIVKNPDKKQPSKICNEGILENKTISLIEVINKYNGLNLNKLCNQVGKMEIE